MKITFLKVIIFLSTIIFLDSCAIVRQGEVGIKRRLGKISPDILTEGPKVFNPFTTVILRLPTRTVNLQITANLPSKEGLTIGSEISILYRIRSNSAPKILQEVGIDYENEVIFPVFRSAAADITAKFYAKDMHSGERGIIEKGIRDQMMTILEPKGFIIENVLMKSISLPQGLSRSIEQKLEAEQDAQRMEFVKQKEKAEAERRLIQAEGDKNAQIMNAEGKKRVLEIEAEGRATAMKTEAEAQNKSNEMLIKNLTPSLLRFRSIEAFRAVSGSNNSKLIINDGKNPLLGLPGSFIE
ncbi:MAG: prohibitin family protein [Cytophagia bacterium]|nr:MAG: prohibitin family protein [Cytophagia bacterium]TAG43876.1 MAG: prohibitin family protein [Cytophagia bacterium]TAH30135.1 MAG: prohibitin family protein [Cytophagales bacterium]